MILPRAVEELYRSLPDFIIVGGQKCGTFALYSYLAQHPQVLPAASKELHFFDNKFDRGLRWYRVNFPTRLEIKWKSLIKRKRFVTGEASPYYMFHPHAPSRIAAAVPDVKIIMLLRSPAERAYSHYNHNLKKRREPLSFEDAIEREEARLDGEYEKICHDESYRSYAHRHYSYKARGIYIDQLKRYERYFDGNQIMVIKNEDLLEETARVYAQVVEFLGLQEYTPAGLAPRHVAGYDKSRIPMERELRAYFEPYNKELYAHLNRDFGW